MPHSSKALRAVLLQIAVAFSLAGQTYTISTIAGGPLTYPNNVTATSVMLNPGTILLESSGNLLFTDSGYKALFRLNPATGVLTLVAGYQGGSSTTDGPVSSLSMAPSGIAEDAAGNIFVSDYLHHRVVKIAGCRYTTVAGNGTFGFSGDGGAATSAQLNYPGGLAVDAAGNLYISDSNNFRVRKVSAAGVIATVAGNGSGQNDFNAPSGDGGPATAVALSGVADVRVDASGNLYFAEAFTRPQLGFGLAFGKRRIRKVSGGVITTIPGTDGTLSDPSGLALDSAGNVYAADNTTVVKISNGTVTTFAGGGTAVPGDGGPATSADLTGPLAFPQSVAVDATGNVYFSSQGRIRKITAGVLSTVAGRSAGPAQAVGTHLFSPADVAADAAGNVFLMDGPGVRAGGGFIYQIAGGQISVVAGSGGSSPVAPPLPRGAFIPVAAGSYNIIGTEMAMDSAGNIYFVDSARILKLSGGLVSGFAGDGTGQQRNRSWSSCQRRGQRVC